MHHHALLVRQTLSAKEALLLCPNLDDVEVFVIPDTVIGIGEVRGLTLEASRRPRELSSRLLIVAVASLTFEAQQALLKLLEEPPATTSFLFIIPPEISLLPTLASRFFTLEGAEMEKMLTTVAFTDLQNSPFADRLEEIGKRMTKKDTVWVEAVKTGLKEYLTENNRSGKSLTSLAFVLAHLNTRGASNKLLLEELALSLPPGRLAKQDGTL